MSITRTTLLGGPAAAIYRGHTFFARDGILVTPALELSVVDSDAQGVLDATVSGASVKIQFTPSSPVVDLLALYPWLEGEPGTSLFGASDSPLVLISANGVRLTFAAVAIVEMPDLLLGARDPVAGAVTFMALGARTLPVSAANRMLSIDTAEVPMPPEATPQLTDDYAITWGGAPWMNLRSREGVRVHFRLATRLVLSDANAVLDLTLERLEVEVRFTPATPECPDEESVFEALGLRGGLPDRALSETAHELVVAGEALVVRLPSAQLIGGAMAFDVAKPRLGELLFVAERVLLESLLILEG